MPPRCPPELMEIEDLLEELLLRFPPDDPASLARAALVSKRWFRLICGRDFRRRFRKYHGTPPQLGFVFLRLDPTAFERLFIPVSSFRPHDRADRRNLKAVHSCHGRVLLHSIPWFSGKILEDLFVWAPITDKLWKLPRWPLYSLPSCSQGNAAVLCAGAVAGDGCDHFDCHLGPFMVVFVGIDEDVQTFTCVYSSQDERWGNAIVVLRRGTLSSSGMGSTSSVAA